MKLSKGILAAAAAVFAVGGAFADPNFDFIQTAGGVNIQAIPEQVLCSLTPEQQRCQFVTQGVSFDVYDDFALSTPKYKGMQP